MPPHQLITETPTRWGSVQAVVERVIEQEKALSQVLRADKTTRHLVPSWQDMEVLESVNKALTPLKEFTDALSRELRPSVSSLKLVLHLFNNQILQHQDGDTELTTSIKEGILKYLNEKYDDQTTQDLLDIVSLVDPRFKTTYIKEEGG
ncbi:E3 SUMO-protein ligase ZBED1-like [Nothobranchius furzeri]|uniref:E3 SUMO-protein ligase ZBED1-like n=1 Tax=Nothobranchius furzeri TaxID=105023 RepID=UPI003904DCF9